VDKRTKITGLAITAIIVLAIGFRFYDIRDYPPGLFPDEAANGEDALLVLDGDVRPFYPRGNGREGLFYILEGISIKLFGIGVWQLHIVSATIGVFTVLAMYFATRPWFGRLAGILAAGFLATSHWHVTLSRTGFRAILIPLFIAFFTAWVGYTIQSVKRGKLTYSYFYAALAGVAFAGGFYTYIAYRIMVGVIFGILILLLLAALHPKIGFPHAKRYWKQTLVGLVAAAIVIAPLLWFFIEQPEAFVGRAGQVSVFNAELQAEYGGGTLLGTILYSTRETIISFFAGNGDLNWRHNVAGFPLLNPLVAILSLLGLAWTIRGTVVVAQKITIGEEVHLGMIYPYVLLMVLGMLVPVITTAEGIPHGLRSIGLVVPIFLLAGTAGSVSLYWFWRRISHSALRSSVYGVAAGLLLLGVLYDGALYFGIARNDALAHYSYRADLTTVAAFINNYHVQFPDRPRPLLVLDNFSLQTIHFLTSVAAHEYTKPGQVHPDVAQHLWEAVEPATSHLRKLEPGEIIIFNQSTFPDADRYQAEHPVAKILESKTNKFGQEIMRVIGSNNPEEELNGETDALDA
jgi:4-amino-4-deoxy-L-arabinose transferase-like glycosyltransferase